MGNTSSALHSASLSGDEMGIIRQIKNGVDVTDQRIAPLHAAALFGKTNALAILLDTPGMELDRGVILSPKLFPGYDDRKNPFPNSQITPLGCAVLSGSLPGVKMLLEKRARLEGVFDGPTSVSLAICSHADTDILSALLDAGAQTGGGADYLALAALQGNVPAMDVLYARGLTTDMTRTLNAVLARGNRVRRSKIPATVAWLIGHGALVQQIPHIMTKLIELRCVETFDIVVGTLKQLLTTTTRGSK